MKRYLLFDAGCPACTRVARAIERESNGWLTARSLHDPKMQALLRKARPEWRWEPTLLEVDSEHVRAFTGLHLYMRVVSGLGLKRSWRIAGLVRQAHLMKISGRFSQNEISLPRRRFVKHLSAVTGLVILPKSITSGIASWGEDDKIIIDTHHLSGSEAETFISLARDSTNLAQFQEKIKTEFQGLFELHVDNANALEVTGCNLIIVRFEVRGGMQSSVYSIVYNKKSHQEVETIYALFYPLDEKDVRVDASIGSISIGAILETESHTIKSIYRKHSSSYPIQVIVTDQYKLIDCIGCCLSGAGVSWYVIGTIAVICTAVCVGSAGTLCLSCILASGAITNGLATYCVSQCYKGINCCTKRCSY